MKLTEKFETKMMFLININTNKFSQIFCGSINNFHFYETMNKFTLDM